MDLKKWPLIKPLWLAQMTMSMTDGMKLCTFGLLSIKWRSSITFVTHQTKNMSSTVSLGSMPNTMSEEHLVISELDQSLFVPWVIFLLSHCLPFPDTANEQQIIVAHNESIVLKAAFSKLWVLNYNNII